MSHLLSWAQISQLFQEKSMRLTYRNELCSQFEYLQQDGIIVTQYEMKIVDLSRHATFLIPMEKENMKSFIEWLNFSIRLQMARETETEITFTQVVDISRSIERIRGQGRGALKDNKPDHFSSFGSASFGGKGHYNRGHIIRTVQLALRLSRGTPGSHGSYDSSSGQSSYNLSLAYGSL